MWQAGRMRLAGRLTFAQRIILVIALGVALGAVGVFVVSLGSKGPDFGWFGYAPLTRSVVATPARLSGWEQLLVWLGLIIVWTAASLWLVKPQPSEESGRSA